MLRVVLGAKTLEQHAGVGKGCTGTHTRPLTS